MMTDKDIREIFQSKFSDFEVPVPAESWESVERSLEVAVSARKMLRRRWYAGSVAAVMLLLISSIYFTRNSEKQTETMISESVSGKPFSGNVPDTEAETGRNPGVAPGAETTERPAVIAQETTAKTAETQDILPATPGGMTAVRMERPKLQTENTERRIDAGMLRLLAESERKDGTQNGKALLPAETGSIGGDNEMLYAGRGVREKSDRPLLLAVHGKGALNNYQQTVSTPVTLRSASAAAAENKIPETSQASNSAESVSEMEHNQPVSFGITVSKYLTGDLSVETGIVYTYLLSKTRNSSNNYQAEEEQKLHYLGIPLNVNYNLFHLKRLNVYASVGGMVEKDVYGRFRKMQEGQVVNLNNDPAESEEKRNKEISQKRPQFSVNAGVGVSYPIYDKLRLYGKIGGAYYFDAKNEYKTIYSDRKIVLDLNLGLRYEF